MHHGDAGLFWAAVPADQWPDHPEHRASIVSKCEPPCGDRRLELVFIGQELDSTLARHALDACLLSDEELAAGPQAWATLPDPFSRWVMETEELPR